MDTATEGTLKLQLLDRRTRLTEAISEVGKASDLVRLLSEVDAALKRIGAQGYGKCEVCHEAAEDDFLLANPLIQYCLCALSDEKQRALERDLVLASQTQWALLPKQNLSFNGWQVHFRYDPAGPVSGDYCDVVAEKNGQGSLFFLVGDVSGKGVAASFQMARLNALFRSLIEVGLPIQEPVARANRLFTENMDGSHFATLVCGKASKHGEIEICNAGHCPPLVVSKRGVSSVDSTGFPVGLVESSPYDVLKLTLMVEETLFLYSDGLTEARDPADQLYGVDRLTRVLSENRAVSPAALAAACLKDLAAFQNGVPKADDLTIMVVRRTG